MELNILPHDKNIYPLRAILIRSESVTVWAKEIQTLQLTLADVQVFPIPNVTPNSVWGCVLVMPVAVDKTQAGRHELCQMVTPNLFISEKSTLFPVVTENELAKMFSSGIHLAHPDFGWVELPEAVDFIALLTGVEAREAQITKPVSSINTPQTIRSFQIEAPSPEEVLKNLTENVFPKKETMEDKPLTILEKAKLYFYRMLFSKGKGEGNVPGKTTPTSWGARFDAFMDKLFPANGAFNKLQQDFEDLEKRNQKQLQRLLDMLRDNPEEALKYAIPLDERGTGRGNPQPAALDFSKRWFDFTWGGNNRGSGAGGSVDLGDGYYSLQTQYRATAQALVAKHEYEKAAFVYMKLLKSPFEAAQTLEAGKYYAEAATLYLKECNNKPKAAECYEKGNMTQEAIALYKELFSHEKVGDLYMTLSNRREAFEHYQKAVDNFVKLDQYVKASLFCKTKMDDATAGQALLRRGWDDNKDAVNCLNVYFSNISESEDLEKEIMAVCNESVSDQNREAFLTVLLQTYKKQKELRDALTELAYEQVAKHIPVNPTIVSRLNEFNPGNAELFKDTLQFKLLAGKKKQ